MRKQGIAAIVPAFNEGPRIADVLRTLSRTACLDEIIVVDDGSTDGTAQTVKAFPKARCLRNARNLGKSHAMDRGVRATEADILFFCDADLEGLTPGIVEAIIAPVRRGEYDMFIGVRGNEGRRSLRTAVPHSGQRALRRSVWEGLDGRFKRRFRIEVGLNHAASRQPHGYGIGVFPYDQTMKERKYGFLKGTALRWRMHADVAAALLLVAFLRAMHPGSH